MQYSVFIQQHFSDWKKRPMLSKTDETRQIAVSIHSRITIMIAMPSTSFVNLRSSWHWQRFSTTGHPAIILRALTRRDGWFFRNSDVNESGKRSATYVLKRRHRAYSEKSAVNYASNAQPRKADTFWPNITWLEPKWTLILLSSCTLLPCVVRRNVGLSAVHFSITVGLSTEAK